MIRQREQNIALSGKLKELINTVDNKEKDWKDQVKKAEEEFPEDIIETLNIVGKSKGKKSQNYQDAMKLLNARVTNLESNLHIEIDMERIEDRSKALSYIGIEVADALKSIPAPVEDTVPVETTEQVVEQVEPKQKAKKVKAVQNVEQNVAQQEYEQSVTFETKPSLWQRIKNSKIVRAIKYITKIRIVIEYPALPEGKGANN